MPSIHDGPQSSLLKITTCPLFICFRAHDYYEPAITSKLNWVGRVKACHVLRMEGTLKKP
jgi:hypothetical protein